MVNYSDDRNELWGGGALPSRLSELGIGVVYRAFDATGTRLVLRHSDGRAYLLDLDWLRAMGGEAATLPLEELVRLACEGPLASGAWDEATLVPYLEGRPALACQ